jgi:hypothetical protein
MSRFTSVVADLHLGHDIATADPLDNGWDWLSDFTASRVSHDLVDWSTDRPAANAAPFTTSSVASKLRIDLDFIRLPFFYPVIVSFCFFVW